MRWKQSAQSAQSARRRSGVPDTPAPAGEACVPGMPSAPGVVALAFVAGLAGVVAEVGAIGPAAASKPVGWSVRRQGQFRLPVWLPRSARWVSLARLVRPVLLRRAAPSARRGWQRGPLAGVNQ